MLNNFGNNLMMLRKKNGYSQEDLANKLNVTRQTISKWELEQTSPNLKDLKNIASIFNVSLDDLTSNINNDSNSNINIKKRKNKHYLIIGIILISIIIIFFIYRSYKIVCIKNNVDLACNSQNYYIEKTILIDNSSEQKTLESYKLFFLDGKIKIVTLDNMNLSNVTKTEILDNDSYYCIDELNKTYFYIPIQDYYEQKLDSSFPILKDSILNEIYMNFSISNNKELLKLIFNFNFKIKNEFNEYFTITNIENKIDNYMLLQASTNSNKFEYINKKEENNNLTQYNYFIELDCVENKDVELQNLLEYNKIDI